MNNKIKVPLLIIMAVLVIGGVSAVLVNYLSNTAEANVEVVSPLTVQFAEVDHGETVDTAIDNVADEDVTWLNNLFVSETTGLSTIEIGVKIENLADVTVADKILRVEILNSVDAVDCNDFTSITFIDVGASEGTTPYKQVQELVGIGLCTDNGETISFDVPINMLGAEQIFKYPVTMTFGNVEPSTYQIKATLVNE